MISSVRAARMALGWSQPDLAKHSGVSLVAIARLESNSASPRLSTVSKIKDALTQAGIRILDDQPEGGYTITVSQRAVEALETSLQTRRDDKESARDGE
ncbi:MAG: helix-turn-helix domain-containing protein [Alcaligenaceae bacterium]|nr:helix-turn-helix domain-containing protein [Alcaligenaceae bacterium]